MSCPQAKWFCCVHMVRVPCGTGWWSWAALDNPSAGSLSHTVTEGMCTTNVLSHPLSPRLPLFRPLFLSVFFLSSIFLSLSSWLPLIISFTPPPPPPPPHLPKPQFPRMSPSCIGPSERCDHSPPLYLWGCVGGQKRALKNRTLPSR